MTESQKTGWFLARRPLLLHALLIHAFLLLFFFPAGVCFAQGRHLYKPPPASTDDDTGSPRTRRSGGSPRLAAPGAARGKAAGGGGFASKRNRLAKGGEEKKQGWEEWWARNRYEFFDFPGDMDGGAGKSSTARGTLARTVQLKIGAIQRIYAKSDKLELRCAAIIGLGRQKNRESQGLILEALQKADDETARAAALAPGLARTSSGCHTLLHLVKGSAQGAGIAGRDQVPAGLRRSAAIALGLSRSGLAGSVLKSIARDGNNGKELRSAALEGLGLMDDDRSLSFLIDFCDTPRTDEALVCTALACLGRIGRQEAIPLLTNKLRSRSLPVRRSAALALGRTAPRNDSDATAALFRCFSEKSDPLLKGFTLVAAGRIGGKKALKELRLILKRGTTGAIPWAALGTGLALRDSAPDVPAAELMTALAHHDSSVRKAAAIALGLAQRTDAVPALVALLDKSDDLSLRGYCATALGMIGDHSGIDAIRAGLIENQPSVTIQAALALCLLDDTDSATHMVELLFATGDEATKVMLTRCLLHLASRSIAKSIIESIETTACETKTRALCLDLLSKLAADRQVHLLDRMACGSSFADELPFVEPHLDSGI